MLPDNSIAKNVSRETFLQLKSYVDLLCQWNAQINLVGDATVDAVWQRHIDDCAQLMSYMPPPLPAHVVDIGSGAGLPGIILSILGCPLVTLVESDRRKCIFLREVVRQLDLSVDVCQQRIEKMPSLEADVVVSRACAPLPKLLDYAYRHLSKNGRCLFLKGKLYEREISFATPYRYHYTAHQSLYDSQGVVLEVKQLRRET